MSKTKNSSQFEVVVVIPFFNERLYVEPTLKCLLRQKYPKGFKWHVVFIDNNSTDLSGEYIEQRLFKSQISYEIIKEKRKGTVYSRTTGMNRASRMDCKVIISTDADTTFPRNFVFQTYRDLIDNNADILVGLKKVHKLISLWQRVVSRRLFNSRRKVWNLEFKYFGPYFFGSFFAINRKFFLNIKKFDPKVNEKFMGEDISLARRCYYQGGKFVNSKSFVRPSVRRIIKEQNNNIASFVGNVKGGYDALFKLSTLNFKVLSKSEELEALNNLLKFEVDRFFWNIADAYIFWKSTGCKYINAKKSYQEGLNFLGINILDLGMKTGDTTTNRVYKLIRNKCMIRAKSKIYAYLNEN